LKEELPALQSLVKYKNKELKEAMELQPAEYQANKLMWEKPGRALSGCYESQFKGLG
jgi:hypothetical protein